MNKAIKHEHLYLPTAEEIFSQMSGVSYFSKLDASSGYWQIKVDEQSSNLLTFSTPSGKHFKHLPYGIHSASEVFQRDHNYFGHTRQCEFPRRLRSMGENFTGT